MSTCARAWNSRQAYLAYFQTISVSLVRGSSSADTLLGIVDSFTGPGTRSLGRSAGATGQKAPRRGTGHMACRHRLEEQALPGVGGCSRGSAMRLALSAR